MITKTDIIIIGSGVSGLFTALNLPKDKNILIITKDKVENSDSFLAQGGICVLKNEDDYDSYFEDTLKAGHYENDKKSVEIMIRSSQNIIHDLIEYGVVFEKNQSGYAYTREGAHATPRIMYHKDITGKEITSKLLEQVRQRDNIKIMEDVTMLDIVADENRCYGIVCEYPNHTQGVIAANYTVLACGGVGGLYVHSTNFRHLTADGLAISLKHGITLKQVDYVQIHPTTLYSTKPGRRFLISESVRGEGAVLYNANKERFVNELLPRDVLTQKIYEEMEKDKTPYVWLSLAPIPEEIIKGHFPNIYQHCLEEGYNITRDCIPVVPAQHYFMGGIKVDYESQTSLKQLYAIGETSCNGVHGCNRLASNSLLESLVFSKRAALEMTRQFATTRTYENACFHINWSDYKDITLLQEKYKKSVLDEMERNRRLHVK